MIPKVPPRDADSHKGTYGRVLVVAGSRGMSGAAVLCGSAALRSGAGLVCVATPKEVQNIVAIGNPCYTTHALDADSAVDDVLKLARTADVLAVGPGLGQSHRIVQMVEVLLSEVDKPIVLDADALNVLRVKPRLFADRQAPVLLTPHPGEFSRLIQQPISHVQANRESLAKQFAAEHKCLLILKGAGTIITDGERVHMNTTGNPGMATGGSGDVLAGVLAALIPQMLSAWDAAVLGVHLHGRAGDLAAAKLGQVSLIASDLLDWLPVAFQEA
jgi:ADP-dependent NAD(P)H-hydrate dehydratase